MRTGLGHLRLLGVGTRVRRLLLGAAVITASAFAAPTVFTPVHAAAFNSGVFYLSLGDSLARGVQPDRLGVSVETSHGYVDDLDTLEALTHPGLQQKKLGCPGETTTTMINGGICSYPLGNQLHQAVRFLRTHTVAFITIDIGANNVDNCLSGGTIDLNCLAAGFAAAQSDLPHILGWLHKAAPTVPIYAMNYYDPFLAVYLQGQVTLAQQSVALADNFNALLDGIYSAAGVPVADVSSTFQTDNFNPDPVTGIPTNVTLICQWTWMCAPAPRGPNIHANDNGYVHIAQAFYDVIS